MKLALGIVGKVGQKMKLGGKVEKEVVNWYRVKKN